MIEFEGHPDCTLCPLNESSNSPGLPTRTFLLNQEKSHDRALVIVGQSSGANEDRQGKSFLGFTGKLLLKMIIASKLTDYVDIFLTNAIRCRPPQGANETQGQMKKCRPYLIEDIEKIQSSYDEVIVLNLGAKASFSTGGFSSLTKSLRAQGTTSSVLLGVRAFSTYHPAILHERRKPELIVVVQSHFQLLLRYLKGEKLPSSMDVQPEVGISIPRSAATATHISNDIETYGILKGVDQTVFCPHKSFHVDGIPYDLQVVTIGFGWQCDVEKRIRTAVYRWDDLGHRRIVRKWFRMICQQKKILVGQHIKFDLMYQYMADPELSFWINPNRLTVDDTLLTSFLLYEHQPEKGLKEMCNLHGILDYSSLLVTGKTGTAKNSRDPDLHLYQAVDCWATLELYKYTLRQIATRYGKDSFKSAETCAQMRNMVVWDVFDLEWNGSTIDVPRLRRFHEEQTVRCGRLAAVCEGRGLKLAGKGSQKPLQEFMLTCLTEAELDYDDRVIYTPKTKDISLKISNCNLVLENLPKTASCYRQMKRYVEHKKKSKVISTYTRPLLGKPSQGIVKVEGRRGMVYPSWYMVPLYNEGGADEGQGGQIQGRFSAKKPARMTEPRSIRDCTISRWETGKIIEYDVEQDHLRMAALLSGDPELMASYEVDSESIHTRTARSIFPDHPPEGFENQDKWKLSDYYKTAKTVNFLVLFGGGPAALQSTALEDAEVDLDIEFCGEILRKWYAKYHYYKDWQDKIYRDACATGYMIIPTGWSRTFGPPGSDLSACRGEILNAYHQIPCAQLLQSSHFAIQCDFKKKNLRSKIVLQIYDALFLDQHRGEEKTTHEIIDKHMNYPPLLPVLYEWCGRSVPWNYAIKEY